MYLQSFTVILLSSMAEFSRMIANTFLWMGPLILAVWVAELNADWLASHYQGSASDLLDNLSKPHSKRRWQNVLDILTHPPDVLRRWLLNQSERAGTFWLLILFPLGYVVLYVMLNTIYGSFLSVQNWLDGIPREQSSVLFIYALGQMGQYFVVLLKIYAILVLVWPFVAGLWETFMGADGHSPSSGLIFVSVASGLFLLISSYVGTFVIYRALVWQTEHANLAMAVSSGNIARGLYFPESRMDVQPFIAISSYERLNAASHLRNANSEFTVLMVFRNNETLPVTLQSVQNSLSIGLINEQGEIIQIEELMPGKLVWTRPPVSGYRFALVTQRGWFADHNIQAGDRIEIKGWPPAMTCLNLFFSNSCK
jgi:uncharacterized membrane protein (UPF0127 family)